MEKENVECLKKHKQTFPAIEDPYQQNVLPTAVAALAYYLKVRRSRNIHKQWEMNTKRKKQTILNKVDSIKQL